LDGHEDLKEDVEGSHLHVAAHNPAHVTHAFHDGNECQYRKNGARHLKNSQPKVFLTKNTSGMYTLTKMQLTTMSPSMRLLTALLLANITYLSTMPLAARYGGGAEAEGILVGGAQQLQNRGDYEGKQLHGLFLHNGVHAKIEDEENEHLHAAGEMSATAENRSGNGLFDRGAAVEMKGRERRTTASETIHRCSSSLLVCGELGLGC
jgi:hypothetical protein